MCIRDRCTTLRSGTPSITNVCEASIRLPSISSGTTSAAPAAFKASRSVSSCERTSTGKLGASKCTWCSTFSADGVLAYVITTALAR